MCTLETGIYSVFWHEILDRVNGTNKQLQDPKPDLNAAMETVKSLKSFVETKHECFNEYERQGAEKSGTTEYVQTRHRRRDVQLNPLDYGRASEAELSPSQRFCAENYIPVIHQFISSLEQRLSAHELICSRFGFLDQLEKLFNIYKHDLDQCLHVELIQFAEF